MASQLTARQKEILLFGSSTLAGRGFIGSEEEAAWMRHRSELLAAAGFSGRPAGYVRFELCESPQWIEDVYTLFERGLLPAPTETPTMLADQGWDLHCEFEDATSIRQIGLPVPLLEGMLREFGQVEAYMKFRRRQALTRKYARIGAAIREVLRETIIILVKKETKHAN